MTRNEKWILHFVRVVSGNRVTLPEDVRRILQIKEGDYLRAEVNTEDRKIVLTPAQ
ncbi:MAG: AbrB/MazE/SpoVT family DNA-binding domain-containing protein [Methanobacteriota archaeon]|nr:MAG: AbrB/MazE/SpoVT family DNA-binding domain-containing protein [Euryarchaeota archaeon]